MDRYCHNNRHRNVEANLVDAVVCVQRLNLPMEHFVLGSGHSLNNKQ